MQDLTPVGLTKDGKQLVLVSSAGEEFAVPVDTRLRAALRGENATTRPVGDEDGKRTAPPRHPGAHPRGRVPRGRRSSRPDHGRGDHGLRRRRCSPSGPTSPRARDAPRSAAAPVSPPRPATPSARRPSSTSATTPFTTRTSSGTRGAVPDGRWALVASYAIGGQRAHRGVQPRPARPLRGRGERRGPHPHRRASRAGGTGAKPGGRSTQGRRLSAVPSQDELPLGDDAIELVREPAADEPTDLQEVARDG